MGILPIFEAGLIKIIKKTLTRSKARPEPEKKYLFWEFCEAGKFVLCGVKMVRLDCYINPIN